MTILTRKLSNPIRLDIEEWLREYRIENYTIKSNYEIDVGGDVRLYNKDIKEFPEYIQFGVVEGSFDCNHNNLTSLRGCPRIVGGYFDCSYNRLTSLRGAPEEVDGNFYCQKNKITSLEGAPREVGGNFICAFNTIDFPVKDVKKVCRVGKIVL